jgi:adenylate kinase family enzyme
MERKTSRRCGTLFEADRFCRLRMKDFRSDADVLDAISLLTQLRSVASSDTDAAHRASLLDRRATVIFGERLRRSSPNLQIVSACERVGLGVVESEILAILIASELGTIRPVHDIEDLQKRMNRRGAEALAIVRALSPEASLVASETVTVDDTNGCHSQASLNLRREVLEPFVRGGSAKPGWDVETQQALLEKAYALFRELVERSRLLDEGRNYFRPLSENLNPIDGKIERLTRTFRHTLDGHADWPVSRINAGFTDGEVQMAFVLIGKELGYLDAHDHLFTGEGLARCASMSVPLVSHNLQYLRSRASLRSNDLVRVCGGPADQEAHEDDSVLMACEFELTPDFRQHLGIAAARRQRRLTHQPRTPSVKIEALALSDEIRSSLDLIIAQIRYRSVLFEDWGMQETVPYGRGTTVLFSGPPGVGKTACADAIAHRLEMPIITANYAELESMWVGETEKNIARLFREAADTRAVLFWDECDAMLFDRTSASRNWEVRQINVLLQEIERFEGVCILSTNRKVTLDSALERRIALKLEFQRPDYEIRKMIWRKQIPAKLPLGDDVDIDRLATRDMTGGEIKNAVLNAARMALARDPRGRVMMSDFERATAMETLGRWSNVSSHRIGFASQAGGN